MSEEKFEMRGAFETYFDEEGNVTEEYLDEEIALKELIESGSMLIIPRSENLIVMVNCSDAFYFASADCEPIQGEAELESLYRWFQYDNRSGPIAWAAIKRNMKPCKNCWIDPMKKKGTWTPELDALPDGPQSK